MCKTNMCSLIINGYNYEISTSVKAALVLNLSEEVFDNDGSDDDDDND